MFERRLVNDALAVGLCRAMKLARTFFFGFQLVEAFFSLDAEILKVLVTINSFEKFTRLNF